MAFRFKRKESATRAARRICRERLAHARRRLDKCDGASSVHDVRKEIKKTRAVLRLVRPEIKRGAFRKLNKTLRQAAGLLSTPRDARVRLKALDELLNGAYSKKFKEIKEIAQRDCRKETRQFAQKSSIALIKDKLRKTRRRIKSLKIETGDWRAIETGLLQSYRCGQLCYKTVLKNPSSENFHEWRKRVKDLWYHLHLLCSIWPKEIGAMINELEKLSDLLGDDHDLTMLKQFISETVAGDGRDVSESALNQLIAQREKSLRSRALKIGAKFYSERPQGLCMRLERHWKTWRGVSKSV